MKIKRYLYSLILLFVAFACAPIEESEYKEHKGERVSMQLTASIDNEGPETKTFLDGEPVASVRNTYWLPEDSIAVVGVNSVACFTNTCTEKSLVAVFDGEVEPADRYYALYPYCSYTEPSSANGHSFEEGTLNLCLPEVQKYEHNTFATDLVPMVAEFIPGEDLTFRNVCGGLVFKLTGTDKIVSAKLVAYDLSGAEARISGQFSIDMNSEEYIMTPLQDAYTSVSVDCLGGIQLNANAPTAFHILLPPGVYNGFKMTFVSENGKYMILKTEKELNVRRSNITYVSSRLFEDNLIYEDLSLAGTSNCYVVPCSGAYSFDATIIGNGESGIIRGADFHTEIPFIEPKSVEVLWQDSEEDIVYNVSLKDGRVCFIASGKEGNALLAVKDSEEKILWSWHIWVTDRPKEQIYVNRTGVYTVLDRNIGAIHVNSESGDELKDAMGTLYFWGRKDPFYSQDSYQRGRISMSIEESIIYPTVIHGKSKLSESWVEPANNLLWSETQKTIYDPCPVGYRVPISNIWDDFTVTHATTYKIEEYNIKGGFDNGFNFYINQDKSESAWYPLTHWITWYGGYQGVNNEGYCWCSDYTDERVKKSFSFHYSSDWDTEVALNRRSDDSYGLPVRCMKDNGYVNVTLPELEIIEVQNITPTSADVRVNIISSGYSDVTERGVIYAQKADFSDGIMVKCGAGAGEFTANMSGLISSTAYYVKAYAINGYGEIHSKSHYFATAIGSEDLKNAVDLSENGTANCYIVKSPGVYLFKYGVKGNSTESIGTPVSAEVIWETKNTDLSVKVGEIVANVQITGAYISFIVPRPYTPGNALIAVKGADGEILWSWHIWVSDYVPEATAQTYVSGAVMMDRNLGALDSGANPTSYGFLYQWGRKDPLIGSAKGDKTFATTVPADLKKLVDNITTDKLEYTIQHPTHLVRDLDLDKYSWGTDKTMYDPCPSGWRVPDGGANSVWNGWNYNSGINKTDIGGKVCWVVKHPYSDPEAYYPAPGYTSNSGLDLYFPGAALYCWSCSSLNDREAYGMHLFDRLESQLVSHKASEYSVRCMREE